MGRRLLFVAFLVLVAASFSWTAASNSAGAPSTAAEAGCTCHNANANTAVQVKLTGLPAKYESNKSYEFTISITGGPMVIPGASQNQGGFALKVSDGALVAGTGSQIRDGGKFATHTAAGNSQRTWTLKWDSPKNATANVTFSFAGNAVNGDTVNAASQDQWNKGTMMVPPADEHAGMIMSPTPTSRGTPLPGAFALAALGVAVLAFRRR